MPRVDPEDTCLAGPTTKPANSPRYWRSPLWVLELAFTGRQSRSPRWQGPRWKSPTELILSFWRRCQHKQRTMAPPPTPLQRLTTLRQTTFSTTLTPQMWHPSHLSFTPMHSHILVIKHLKNFWGNYRVKKFLNVWRQWETPGYKINHSKFVAKDSCIRKRGCVVFDTEKLLQLLLNLLFQGSRPNFDFINCLWESCLVSILESTNCNLYPAEISIF